MSNAKTDICSYFRVLNFVDDEFINDRLKAYKGGKSCLDTELFKQKQWFRVAGTNDNTTYLGYRDGKQIFVDLIKINKPDELGLTTASEFGGKKQNIKKFKKSDLTPVDKII